MGKIYSGVRSAGRAMAFVTLVTDDPKLTPVKRDLDPMTTLVRHSGGDFDWGYPGPAPAQLALALCCDFLGKDQLPLAIAVYRTVLKTIVCHFENKTWMLYDHELEVAIAEAKHEILARGGKLPT